MIDRPAFFQVFAYINTSQLIRKYLRRIRKGCETIAKRLVSADQRAKPQRKALSPEARENQLIARAVDLAEKQLIEGTASSQVIVHYLKLGTQKEKEEVEKLRRENELLIAKKEAYQSAKHVEELYSQAIEAMKSYSGSNND